MEALIPPLAEGLLPWLDKPFAYFGHSLGGLIAFELIQYLRRTQQIEPVHFWVSATRAPHIPAPEPAMHSLPDQELILGLRRYNGTPAEVLENDELMALLLPTLRADFALLETYRYRPQPALNCPITAFWGEQDTIVNSVEVAAWQSYTQGRFQLEMFSGDHFFIHHPSVIEKVRSP
jgi:medium-chain acyl-[acyl-carrier-protein] hydrolase